MAGLEVGSEAPDFTLLEAPGKKVTLSEELKKGPVVLVFYPADFTSVCQEELCMFRDALVEYNDIDVVNQRIEWFKDGNGLRLLSSPECRLGDSSYLGRPMLECAYL